MKKVLMILAVFTAAFSLSACNIDINLDGDDNSVQPIVCEFENLNGPSTEIQIFSPGETREEDCNTCTCSASGEWFCTMMNCDGTPPGDDDDNDDDNNDDNNDDDVATYDGPDFITLYGPQDGDVFDGVPIEFTGVVSPNTDMVVVTAKGDPAGVNPYVDVYTLQNFNYGDTEFTYRAKMEWDNLTQGANDYRFEAYHDNTMVSALNVTIHYLPNPPVN